MSATQNNIQPDLGNDPQSNYEHVEFKDLVCEREQIISKEFYNCTFIKCSFRETSFKNCKFLDCTFKKGDLTMAKVPASSFQNTKFESTQLIGINWADANWPKVTFQKPFEFHNCVLNYSTFINAKLKGIVLRKCMAKDVDFSDADLTQADCRDTDFTNSRFIETDLTEADFTHAHSYQINPALVTLSKTKFSLPEAIALLYGLDIVLTE